MRSWIAILAATMSVAAFVPLVQHRASAVEAPAKAVLASSAAGAKKLPPLAGPPPLSGIEIDKLVVHDDEVVAPAAAGRIAHLSIDPNLQRAASKILRQYSFPEAAVVVLETAGARVLVWASHVERGRAR